MSAKTPNGLDYINKMKDLFIEGCINNYFNSLEEVKKNAESIKELENFVNAVTKFNESDSKSDFDINKVFQEFITKDMGEDKNE